MLDYKRVIKSMNNEEKGKCLAGKERQGTLIT